MDVAASMSDSAIEQTHLIDSVRIEKIYLDREVKEHPKTRFVLEKLSGIPLAEVSDRQKFLEQAGSFSISQGKRNLWITRFLGSFLKPCPGTHAPYLCCNYWILNLQMNCPLDCSYCILQNYTNFPLLTLFVNLEKIHEEIEALQEDRPNRLLRIGTGELTDSLVLDPLTHWNEHLIRFVSEKPVLLELKTKTSNVSHLPRLKRRNVAVSCSMNPRDIIQAEEYKTASFDQRLQALREAVQKGYRIGIHLDPILEVEDWENKYKEMIQGITEALQEEDVVWISLGTLRFPGPLKDIADERFPRSRAFLGEFVPCTDGKMRYFRPIRTRIYQKIYAEIRTKWNKVFIYFCMEHPVIWEQVLGFRPLSNHHVDYLFHESVARRFPDLELPAPGALDYGIA